MPEKAVALNDMGTKIVSKPNYEKYIMYVYITDCDKGTVVRIDGLEEITKLCNFLIDCIEEHERHITAL